MAPNTALSFLIVGSALLLMDARKRGRPDPSRVLASLSLLIGMLAAIGYAYGVKGFFGIGHYTAMALNTAVTFVIFGAGLICARPERGIVALAVSDSPGGIVFQRLLPTSLATVLVLGWLISWGESAGVYVSTAGTAIFAVLLMVVLTSLATSTALALRRTDNERKRAEHRERELEARQRDFCRRTILAATGGKLEIVEPDAIRALGGQMVRKWEFHTPDKHFAARQEAFELAEDLGLAGDRLHDFMACVGETMSNALKHAGGGEASVRRTDSGIIFVVSDTGLGIDSINLPEVALVDGYSTGGTGGLGYKLIIACADKVYLATGLDGTTVAVEMRLG
jgi:anti-sigma regulatory factor (Ser/Thr protein kinase)